MDQDIEIFDPTLPTDEEERSIQYIELMIDRIARRYAEAFEWFENAEASLKPCLQKLADAIGLVSGIGDPIPEEEARVYDFESYRNYARVASVVLHEQFLLRVRDEHRPIVFDKADFEKIVPRIIEDPSDFRTGLGLTDAQLDERVPKLLKGAVGVLLHAMESPDEELGTEARPLCVDGLVFLLRFGGGTLEIQPPKELDGQRSDEEAEAQQSRTRASTHDVKQSAPGHRKKRKGKKSTTAQIAQA